MAWSSAEAAIKAKILAGWTRPLVPVFWLNEGLTVPVGPFAMFFIQGVAEKIVAFGGGRGQNEYVTWGTVHGLFFVPIGGPIALAQAMRDEFADTLRSQRFSGVSILGVVPLGGGSSADSAKHIHLEALAELEYRFKG